MSTVVDTPKLRAPKLPRAGLIIVVLVVTMAAAGVFLGRDAYRGLTTNTVVVYLAEANALYPGDRVQIMGIDVGAIDAIEPDGDKMKVSFHYSNKHKVPADATVVVVNPSLVASRVIQLEPPYSGGAVLADGAVIPIERTQVPVEWDELRSHVSNLVEKLGPTPEQPKGPFGDVLESFADGLAGKGKQFNETLTNLSQALTALNEGRGDFFAVVRSLALFVSALHRNDQTFVSLNHNLAQFTDSFTNSNSELANALQQTDVLLTTAREFFTENRNALAQGVNNIAEVTTEMLKPAALDGLETIAHTLPHAAANGAAVYEPSHGALTGQFVFTNFANPMQLLCSAIQAGSRLGYQESAELCAQYLAPILDAIKLNYPPFGVNLISTAATLPKYVDYSEERLRPPPGYKDTTVPGVFSPDTPFSHGNHEPGWIVAPGMQGLQVQPHTARMLTPESLAELMGGPDIAAPPEGRNMAGPPNAYDQSNPMPPPWYPQPLPSPTPAPPHAPAPFAAEQPSQTGAEE